MTAIFTNSLPINFRNINKSLNRLNFLSSDTIFSDTWRFTTSGDSILTSTFFFAKSLSALLEYGCVFTFEELTIYEFLRRRHNMDWEIANYGFGASAEHPFLKEIIINCAKSQLEPEWAAEMLSSIPFFFQKEFKILCTTGPGMVTRTLAENLHIAKTVKLLFPDDVRDKSNWHCFGDIAVHLQSASWRSRKDFIKRKLSGYWEIMTRKKLYKKSCLLGECRSIDSLV